MEIKVLFFGEATDRVGCSALVVKDILTTNALKSFLLKTYPHLMGLKFGLALNKRLVLEDLQLKDQDVIAILPPFSGG